MHALIEAIRAAPDDDEPRLVYADWVARTDPARGELIALQIRVARATTDDVIVPEHARMTARIRALLREHAARWTAPLRAIADATYTFRRGFVEHVDGADPNAWRALAATAPILRSARVEKLAPVSVFEALCLAGFELDQPAVQRLEEALVDGPLRSLEIEEPHSTDHRALARCAAWPMPLVHFRYSARRSGGGVLASGYFLQALANAPARDRLRSLVLANLRLDHLGGGVAMLPGVASLALSGCRLGRAPANLATIVGAMPRLRALVLEADTFAREQLEAVVAQCPHVVHLALRDLRIVASTLEALAPWSAQLRRLDLSGNRLDDRAVDAIVRMAWPALVALRVTTRFVGPAAKARLAERFGDALQR